MISTACQLRRIRPRTGRRICSTSSPDGRLPGRSSDSTGRPGGLEDLDGLEAVAAGMGVEQCKLLLSMHSIVRVVNVEHDAAGYALEAGTEQIDQFKPHARKLAPERGVLQA